jgi:hypothetical protein
VDARMLAELVRSGMLRAVYRGENGRRTLRELRAALRPSLNNVSVVCDERGIHRRTAQTSQISDVPRNL